MKDVLWVLTIDAAAKSLNLALGEDHCNEECIKAQLNAFYEQCDQNTDGVATPSRLTSSTKNNTNNFD